MHPQKSRNKLYLIGMVILAACSSTTVDQKPSSNTDPIAVPTDPVLVPATPDAQVLRSEQNTSIYAVTCYTPGALKLGPAWSLNDTSLSLAADGTLVLKSLGQPSLTPYGFDLSVISADTAKAPLTVYVRCLPQNFPKVKIEGRFTDWLMLTTGANPLAEEKVGSFRIIMEPNGFPAHITQGPWMVADFFREGDRIISFQDITLPPGAPVVQSFSNTPGMGFQSAELYGPPDTKWVPTKGAGLDPHAATILPNGNLLGLIYEEVVDTPIQSKSVVPSSSTTQSCEPAPAKNNDPVLRGRIVEVTSSGEVVHNWRIEDHLPQALRAPLWISIYSLIGKEPYCAIDAEHLNAITFYQEKGAPKGEGTAIVTGRHIDGAIMVKWPQGEVLWSLGGNSTDKSLQIIGDPLEGLSLPHDAHFLSKDEVMVFDNRTFGKSSRVVVYRIDLATRSATLIETYTVNCPTSISSKNLCGAFAMGSARLTLDGKKVLIGMGTSNVTAAEIPRVKQGMVQEATATLVLEGSWSYRVLPAEPFDSMELYRSQIPAKP